MARNERVKLQTSFEPRPILVEKLLLDPKNPRLGDTTAEATQAEILQTLWSEFAVDEIALSIAANGFFPYEPLFAATAAGNYIVIEGNRRLAAVKLLLSADLRKKVGATDLPSLTGTQNAPFPENRSS